MRRRKRSARSFKKLSPSQAFLLVLLHLVQVFASRDATSVFGSVHAFYILEQINFYQSLPSTILLQSRSFAGQLHLPGRPGHSQAGNLSIGVHRGDFMKLCIFVEDVLLGTKTHLHDFTAEEIDETKMRETY